MKILNVKVKNFGPYKYLEFSYDSKGLVLIQGPTGSGKSTLFDIPTWCLLSTTAKKGSVDHVRSWYNPDEPTVGVINVQIGPDTLEVTRIRGKTTENDLYWTENGKEQLIRGKDLSDTQNLLEARLGVSKDLFLVSSYFNESNRALTFFSDKLSARREFFESILDLKLITNLVEKIAEKKKEYNKVITNYRLAQGNLEGQLTANKRQLQSLESSSAKWAKDKDYRISQYEIQGQNFDNDRAAKLICLSQHEVKFQQDHEIRVNTINFEIAEKQSLLSTTSSKACPTCGNTNKHHNSIKNDITNLLHILEKAKNSQSPYTQEKTLLEAKINNFELLIEQEKNIVNPYIEQIATLLGTISDLKIQEGFNLEVIANLVSDIKDLEQLNDLVIETRGHVFRSIISKIQQDTNSYLESHFDSELKVEFTVDQDDSIDVVITKDSHECAYTQLSKGQRGILKLCFATSVMETAANVAGIHFDLLMYDESLDGLDSEMKTKAYALFQKLSVRSASVLVIDHSMELKSLFDETISVSNNNGNSEVVHVR